MRASTGGNRHGELDGGDGHGTHPLWEGGGGEGKKKGSATMEIGVATGDGGPCAQPSPVRTFRMPTDGDGYGCFPREPISRAGVDWSFTVGVVAGGKTGSGCGGETAMIGIGGWNKCGGAVGRKNRVFANRGTRGRAGGLCGGSGSAAAVRCDVRTRATSRCVGVRCRGREEAGGSSAPCPRARTVRFNRVETSDDLRGSAG